MKIPGIKGCFDKTRGVFYFARMCSKIRLHAAAGLHAPIVGDKLYGAHPAERLMLHACYLSFLDPDGARRLEFTSACPF